MGYSVRTERFHYIEWIDAKSKQPTAIELYILQSDPYELTNIAGKKQHQAAVTELGEILEDGWKAALPKENS
jgi:arylsulfatase A-like enzyme